MLNQIMLVLTVGILVLTVPLVSASGNSMFNKSECALNDIDSRLRFIVEIVENTRQKLPDDIKEVCRKDFCEEKPIDCTKCPNKEKPIDCTKCPYEEKPIDCTKCPYKEKPTNGSECENGTHDAKPMDCSDIYHRGYHGDGSYEIWPQSRISKGPLVVFCDMTDGGGWTVIQRRGNFGNNKTDFYQDWNTYKRGFGDILKEFWIGNDNLFALTSQRPYQIKFDLRDWEENFAYASYDDFWVDDEFHNYTLHVNGYIRNGTAGDSFSFHNGKMFTTRDRNNNAMHNTDCADHYEGAWWYSMPYCFDVHLNGPYLKGKQESTIGVIWDSFKGREYSLKDTVMKIRPRGFCVQDENNTTN